VFPNALDDRPNKKICAERKALKYNVHAEREFPRRLLDRWLDAKQPTVRVQVGQEGSTPKDILRRTALAKTTAFPCAG